MSAISVQFCGDVECAPGMMDILPDLLGSGLFMVGKSLIVWLFLYGAELVFASSAMDESSSIDT